MHLHATDLAHAQLTACVIVARLRALGIPADVARCEVDPSFNALLDCVLPSEWRAPHVVVHAHRSNAPGCPTDALIVRHDGHLHVQDLGSLPFRPLPALHQVKSLLTWRAGGPAMAQRLAHMAHDLHLRSLPHPPAPSPPSTHIVAVAADAAFHLPRPALLASLRTQGAHLVRFSPLSDPLPPDCDALLLCATAPDLHALELASNDQLRAALRDEERPMLALQDAAVYLSEGVFDLDGAAIAMCGRLADPWQQRAHVRHTAAVHATLLQHPLTGCMLQTSDLLSTPDNVRVALDEEAVVWSDDACLVSRVQPRHITWPSA